MLTKRVCMRRARNYDDDDAFFRAVVLCFLDVYRSFLLTNVLVKIQAAYNPMYFISCVVHLARQYIFPLANLLKHTKFE